MKKAVEAQDDMELSSGIGYYRGGEETRAKVVVSPSPTLANVEAE